MEFIYKMNDVYIERGMGVAIGKLLHPYTIPTKIAMKMRMT